METSQMQLSVEAADAAEAQAGDAQDALWQRASRTVPFPALARAQHQHAMAVHVVSFLGFVAAVWSAFALEEIPAALIGVTVAAFVLVGLGGSIGYHRYFTHKSFETGPVFRATLAILGSMAAQGPVIFWVALHRMHHEFADAEGDPHSPNLHGPTLRQRIAGMWHAWFGWTVQHPVPNSNFYARDLLRDPLIVRINKAYYLWVALGVLLPGLAVWLLVGTAQGALLGVLWAGLARIFLWHQMIYVITCLAHVVGRRDYRCKDLSTNNGWLAIPTLGESWHNNHHAFPRAAVLWFEWWQFDFSGLVIAALGKLGVVWKVNLPTTQMRAARRTRT